MAAASLTAATASHGVGPIDLSVAKGEIVALVGASGCGKSTALRLLAGLEAPASGQTRRTAAADRIGYVFQSPTLMPWATVRANVALPLSLKRDPTAHARADDILARFGLGDHLTARPAQLSGGMAMRAALARAMVNRPELLLLDEPFAALDTITRRALIEYLHAACAETRPAVVFVTHDIDEAAYVADRVLVMAPGGSIVDQITLPGPRPRPCDHRASPAHLAAVEHIARSFAATVQSPPTGGRQAAQPPEGGMDSTIASSPPSSASPTLPPAGGDVR